MPFGAISLGVGGVSAVSRLLGGRSQRRRARSIRRSLVDPGIQLDTGLIDSGNILGDNLSNYTLPGFSSFLDSIRSSSAGATAAATRGATSSADLLGAITNIQANEGSNISNLYTTQAGERTRALDRYLGNIEAQGRDRVRVNNAELERYNEGMREAAALEGAGNRNVMSSFDEFITGALPFIQSMSPRTIVDPNTGEIKRLPSIFSSRR